jgi:hypothetical protein
LPYPIYVVEFFQAFHVANYILHLSLQPPSVGNITHPQDFQQYEGASMRKLFGTDGIRGKAKNRPVFARKKFSQKSLAII